MVTRSQALWSTKRHPGSFPSLSYIVFFCVWDFCLFVWFVFSFIYWITPIGSHLKTNLKYLLSTTVVYVQLLWSSLLGVQAIWGDDYTMLYIMLHNMHVVKISIIITYPFTNILFTWKLISKSQVYSCHPSPGDSSIHLNFKDWLIED